MKVISRPKNYIVKDVLVQCDCECGFVRFTVFEDEPERVYFGYYGDLLNPMKDNDDPLTLEEVNELGRFLQGESFTEPLTYGFLQVSREDELPSYDIVFHDKKGRCCWSIVLGEDEAALFGKELLQWAKELEHVKS